MSTGPKVTTFLLLEVKEEVKDNKREIKQARKKVEQIGEMVEKMEQAQLQRKEECSRTPSKILKFYCY